MIKIVPDPTFVFTAQVTVPGQVALGALRLVGRYKTPEGYAAWLATGKEASDDAEFLHGALCGWETVVDEAGQAVPYSVEALRKLLHHYPCMGREVMEQYGAALMESRRKN